MDEDVKMYARIMTLQVVLYFLGRWSGSSSVCGRWALKSWRG